VSLIETSIPLSPDLPVLGFSAVGPLILVMCVLVPARTGWTIGVAMAAATTWPLAYGFNALRLGLPPVPWERLIVWPGLNYVMALLACLTRRRLTADGEARQPAGDLGSYRLLTPIGAGGMGEVWKATHQLLARQAAIKLVRPRATMTSTRQLEESARRFHREANAIAGLQSPHTISLYDFGVARDGQFYYVMELLDGLSLETLVATFGPQPASRVRHILLQICESLEEAHQSDLVHRDLKPSNVMLCKVALRLDFVKVLDFGLAKCAACEDVAQITLEGVTAGTPAYIAPEVALGEEHVDGRADVYALGCVAYFLLTGTLVFEDSNPLSMVLKHIQATPTPPSERTELRIPADLEWAVLRCLEKKPADRPASAREAAKLFAACAVEAWTDDAAAAWWGRHLPAMSP
jgi:serine/threonine-protein kinase